MTDLEPTYETAASLPSSRAKRRRPAREGLFDYWMGVLNHTEGERIPNVKDDVDLDDDDDCAR